MTSIIIPAYNAEKYLEAAIASVISQSDSDWELILVDDCSTDSTPTICDEAAQRDSRIHVIHRNNNGGLSAARNTGLDAAQGKYIAFLDADDLLAPDFIRILKTALEKTGAMFAACKAKKFGNKAPVFDSYYSQRQTLVLDSQEALLTALYQTKVKNSPDRLDHSAWGKLYRRELWKDLRFTPGTWYEDLDIVYRLWPSDSKIAFAPVELMGYRQHPMSFLHRYSPSRMDVLDVTDRMVEAVEDSDLQPAARTRRFAAHCNILMLLLANRRPDRAGEARCLRVIRDERGMVLRNRDARLKDRVGALLAFLLF